MLTQFTLPITVQLRQSLLHHLWSFPKLFWLRSIVWPQFSARLCPPNDNEYYVLQGSRCLCLLTEEICRRKSFSMHPHVSSSVRALCIQTLQCSCFQTRDQSENILCNTIDLTYFVALASHTSRHILLGWNCKLLYFVIIEDVSLHLGHKK